MSLSKLDKHYSRYEEPTINISFTPVIVSDSKGKYLKSHIDKKSSFQSCINWYSKGGATSSIALQWLKQNYDKLVQKFGRIFLHIWFGRYDLTVKRGKYILSSSEFRCCHRSCQI